MNHGFTFQARRQSPRHPGQQSRWRLGYAGRMQNRLRDREIQRLTVFFWLG
ncbi:hypothetical protein ACNKHO_10260 [Shigella flexneri]